MWEGKKSASQCCPLNGTWIKGNMLFIQRLIFVIMLEMSDAKQNLTLTDTSVPLIKVWLNKTSVSQISVQQKYDRLTVNAFY